LTALRSQVAELKSEIANLQAKRSRKPKSAEVIDLPTLPSLRVTK
jgi:hypothetical protein